MVRPSSVTITTHSGVLIMWKSALYVLGLGILLSWWWVIPRRIPPLVNYGMFMSLYLKRRGFRAVGRGENGDEGLAWNAIVAVQLKVRSSS